MMSLGECSPDDRSALSFDWSSRITTIVFTPLEVFGGVWFQSSGCRFAIALVCARCWWGRDSSTSIAEFF